MHLVMMDKMYVGHLWLEFFLFIHETLIFSYILLNLELRKKKCLQCGRLGRSITSIIQVHIHTHVV